MSLNFTSLIIPTFKRPESLLRTLTSLQKQTTSSFEIIVVDNAANIEIASLIKNFNHKAKIPAKYFAEPKLGFHYTLHTGANKAEGNLLIFTNDDVTFDKNFVKAYIESFSQHENMSAAGGAIRLKFEITPPKWLADLIGDSKVFPPYSFMEPYKNFRFSPKGFFFETNMAIKRDFFFSLGGFNPDLFGSIRLGDGDTGLNRKIWQKKLLVGYIPEALLYHHIPKERMTVNYLFERYKNEGSSDMYTLLHEYQYNQHFLKLPVFLLSFVKLNIKYLVFYTLLKGKFSMIPIKLNFQLARTSSQLKYIKKYFSDSEFQKFVNKENWLI